MDYNPHRPLIWTAEEIMFEIERSGTPKPKEELTCSKEHYELCPEEKSYPIYSEEAKKKMREVSDELKRVAYKLNDVYRFIQQEMDNETFLATIDSKH